MGILGIPNRTENWKTAQCFAPFFESASARARLVERLLGPIAETHPTELETTKIELFWQGMRDYEHACEQTKKEKLQDESLTNAYNRSFWGLRKEVEQFAKTTKVAGFRDLKSHNYIIEKNSENFRNNLRNTEIDIVLQSPNYLFIGEAKDVSDLGAKSEYVLVHQLIRQYVAAQILLDITQCKKTIVPFLAVDSKKMDSVKNTGQVKFMMKHYCLKEENVLSWDKIVLLG